MSDRFLNPTFESSPLQPELDSQSQDFWDRYFELQQIVSEVSMLEGRFNIDVTNQITGETIKIENVKLQDRQFRASHWWGLALKPITKRARFYSTTSWKEINSIRSLAKKIIYLVKFLFYLQGKFTLGLRARP